MVEAPALDGPWNKAMAIGPALRASTADIVIQADADCFTDGLPDAVRKVEDGKGWAAPHTKLFRLNAEASAAVIAGEDWELHKRRVTEPPYCGKFGGGILIARREALLEVGIDPRFEGWGNEDEAHAFALGCLFGRPWRGKAPLIHLWHPPQERKDRRKGSDASWDLRGRYLRARHDTEAMRALLEEARCPSSA